MSDLIPTTEGVLSRFIGIEEAPVKPDLITLHLDDYRLAQIRHFTNMVNDLLVHPESLNAFANDGYQVIPFHPLDLPEDTNAALLWRGWEHFHESVIEHFAKAGWFVRYVPVARQYSAPPYDRYAFALDPAFLPEVDERYKR